jgi:hypothetical protein
MTVFQVLAQTPPTPHRSSLARGRRPYPEEAADLVEGMLEDAVKMDKMD